MVYRTRRDAGPGKSAQPIMSSSHHHQTVPSVSHLHQQVPPISHVLAGNPHNSNPPSSHIYHSGLSSSTDSGLVTVCQCSAFLDPYPTGQAAQWRSMVGTAPLTSALQHYCRVCNTQLNSCKQARIHVTGKKHEKRLAYLKFSLETSEAAVNNSYTNQYVGGGGLSNPSQVQVSSVMSTAMPTVYAYPPPCGTYAQGPAYYFPPNMPAYQAQHPFQSGGYHDYQQPPVSQPPTSASSHLSPHTPRNTRRSHTTTASASHGVMSPSLTSGFSGSGDCKSTETCSLLSVASYSSATPNGGVRDQRQLETNGNSQNSGVRHVVSCEICHLPFPSRAVLEHHLMGSRHARKVKAETVLRQLQENGAEFRATEATGDIRCEVCEVSVNSSHQLQAHMIGHKHKMRCARQGVAPHRTILTPASSTAPSTTPSEASAPVRSHSILVGRPQFGSRPNLYKTTSAADGRTIKTGHFGGRNRDRVTLSSRVQKMRKIVRPRFKVDSGARQARHVPKEREEEGQAADSTTESDEPGTSKQVSQIPGIKQENNLESDQKQNGEESDEAKESETDPEISNCQHKSNCEQSEVRLSRYASVSHLAKASQTEPLRRFSIDATESIQCPVHHGKNEQGHHDSPIEEEGPMGGQQGVSQEPRRGSNSASYGQVASFQCNLCQISLNSQSQVAQHMGSNKHRRLGAVMQTQGNGREGNGVERERDHQRSKSRYPVKEAYPCPSTQSRDCNVREIPMLSMFLQRLHQHHYFPPIRDDEDNNSAETHR